jgi:hypothetical protein
LPSKFGGAGKGAQRASWQAAMRAEAANLSGKAYAQSLLDLVKAFDKVPHEPLVEAAKRLGFDLTILRLSLASYRLPRTICIDGLCSRLLVAGRGITAGSGFATFELGVLLHEVVVNLNRRWPPLVQMSLYVDDATLECAHKSPEVVESSIAQATKQVIVDLQARLLEVSVKKSGVTASSLRIARRAAATAGTAAWSRTKMLGVATSAGRRRVMVVQKTRVLAFCKRARASAPCAERASALTLWPVPLAPP